MAIQSLSIVVPSKNCINKCDFCVSRMHKDITYENRLPSYSTFPYIGQKNDEAEEKYIKALRYAKDLGCSTLMLTGECEPQQNRNFLEHFFVRYLPKDLFNNIEIQTTGRLLEDYDIEELCDLGINTFSISVSSFDNLINTAIISGNHSLESLKNIIHLKDLCSWIKKSGCLLRLSLNLNKSFYEDYSCQPDIIFKKCKEEFGADQVTLRQLYTSENKCPQNDWIKANCDYEKDKAYFDYIRTNGIPLELLPYGNIKYSIDGVGTVADDDCMSKKNLNEIRYLILRPDCHLYTRWDDPASIIF